MIIRMVTAGEQTGKIDNMLERIADFLDEEIETTLSGLTALIEPILIVFLGVVVGGMVICMFLPIFKLPEIVTATKARAPVSPAAGSACSRAPLRASLPAMAKVLLVDDDLTMVQMVAELLRQEGHEVFPFSNGAAALAALTTHAPDLVITDLYFDKTRAHGLEVVQKARALSPAGGRHRHHRLRHHRNGGRGDEEWGVRLPGEAVQGG